MPVGEKVLTVTDPRVICLLCSERIAAYTAELMSDMARATTAGQPFKLILGSSSLARRQIVTDMGYHFTILSADIDEKSIRKDKAEDLVMALAQAKADAILLKATSEEFKVDEQPTLLITCDQVVVYDDMVREKPNNKDEAYKFLKDYSGGRAATVGSVLVTNLQTGAKKGDSDRVEIYFHDIPEEAINSLIQEGHVLHVAGGLLIEHPLIQPCIKKVVGGIDSVMGLPKSLTERLIKEVL